MILCKNLEITVHTDFLYHRIFPKYLFYYVLTTLQIVRTLRNLQIQLNIVELICLNTGMVVNIGKTKIIVFRNGGFLRRDEKYFINTWVYFSLQNLSGLKQKKIWQKSK